MTESLVTSGMYLTKTQKRIALVREKKGLRVLETQARKELDKIRLRLSNVEEELETLRE